MNREFFSRGPMIGSESGNFTISKPPHSIFQESVKSYFINRIPVVKIIRTGRATTKAPQ